MEYHALFASLVGCYGEADRLVRRNFPLVSTIFTWAIWDRAPGISSYYGAVMISIWLFFFLLSGGSSVLGGDIPRLYGCFSVDYCRRELMLIPAMWHKTRYLLLGFKLMGLVSVQIVLGIVPSPFLLKFHEQSFLVC